MVYALSIPMGFLEFRFVNMACSCRQQVLKDLVLVLSKGTQGEDIICSGDLRRDGKNKRDQATVKKMQEKQ